MIAASASNIIVTVAAASKMSNENSRLDAPDAGANDHFAAMLAPAADVVTAPTKPPVKPGKTPAAAKTAVTVDADASLRALAAALGSLQPVAPAPITAATPSPAALTGASLGKQNTISTSGSPAVMQASLASSAPISAMPLPRFNSVTGTSTDASLTQAKSIATAAATTGVDLSSMAPMTIAASQTDERNPPLQTSPLAEASLAIRSDTITADAASAAAIAATQGETNVAAMRNMSSASAMSRLKPDNQAGTLEPNVAVANEQKSATSPTALPSVLAAASSFKIYSTAVAPIISQQAHRARTPGAVESTTGAAQIPPATSAASASDDTASNPAPGVASTNFTVSSDSVTSAATMAASASTTPGTVTVEPAAVSEKAIPPSLLSPDTPTLASADSDTPALVAAVANQIGASRGSAAKFGAAESAMPDPSADLSPAIGILPAPLAPLPTLPSSAAAALPTLDAPRFADELAGRLNLMAEHHIGHVEISLAPPALGMLDVHLHLDGDKLHAAFGSPNAEVRNVIETQLPRLRELLADSGVMLTGAQVGDGQRGTTPQQPTITPPLRSARDESAPLVQVAAPSRLRSHEGLLDEFA